MMGITLISVSRNDPLSEQIEKLVSRNQDRGDVLICASAIDARKSCEADSVETAWVFSSDDMSASNLAAALAKDVSSARIFSASYMSDEERRHFQDATGVERVFDPKSLFESFRENANCSFFKNGIVNAVESEDLDGSIVLDGLDEPEDPKRSESVLEHDGYASLARSQDPVDLGDSQASSDPETVETDERIERDLNIGDKKAASVISVLSGSGGVGKSSIVATASYLAASKGYSIAVIDCDLQFGDMRQLMGDVPCTSIDDVLMDESLFHAFARSCNKDLPALVCAPSRLEKSEELSSHIEELLDLCASAFDVVFVNTGSSWSEVNAQLVEKSNCNIFIVDQRSSSIRSCQHAVELCMRMGMATGQFMYALNRCARGSLFCAADISSAMQGGTTIEIKDGGSEVEELLGMGLAGELAASKSDFTNSLNELLEEVLP